MSVSRTVSEILASKNSLTLKTGLDITQDHSNWYHSKTCVQFSIRLP